jgi:hypothetical protein
LLSVAASERGGVKRIMGLTFNDFGSLATAHPQEAEKEFSSATDPAEGA